MAGARSYSEGEVLWTQNESYHAMATLSTISSQNSVHNNVVLQPQTAQISLLYPLKFIYPIWG